MAPRRTAQQNKRRGASDGWVLLHCICSQRFVNSWRNKILGFSERNMHHCLTAASVSLGSWAQLAVRIGIVSLKFTVPQSAQYWISVTISKLSGRFSSPISIFAVFIAVSFSWSIAYCLTNYTESSDSSVRNIRPLNQIYRVFHSLPNSAFL